MTDNGSCYRSHDFAAALGDASSTAAPAPTGRRPTARSSGSTARSQPNGPTPHLPLRGQARAATYAAWLHHYNHHRPHTGIGGLPADRVHNLTGNYT